MSKKLLIGVAIIFLIVLGTALFLFSKKPQTATTTENTGPVFQTAPLLSPQDQAQAATVPVVQKSFLAQIQNSNSITLFQATIVMPYALQTWTDSNKGGEALLEYDQSKGWVLISLGGGVWDVPSLVQEGVPELIAKQLVAKQQS